jgi:hypothetical protein
MQLRSFLRQETLRYKLLRWFEPKKTFGTCICTAFLVSRPHVYACICTPHICTYNMYIIIRAYAKQDVYTDKLFWMFEPNSPKMLRWPSFTYTQKCMYKRVYVYLCVCVCVYVCVCIYIYIYVYVYVYIYIYMYNDYRSSWGSLHHTLFGIGWSRRRVTQSIWIPTT